MRIAPRPLVGLIAFVGYFAIVYIVYGATLWLLPFTDSSPHWARRGLLPILLGLGAVFLVLFTRYVGWWRPVMREETRTAPRWTMAVTALYLVVGLVVAATSGVFRLGASQTLTLAFFSVLYGFSYVILYQGLLLVGFRARIPEAGVWFLTSLMFAFPAMFFAFLGGQTPFIDFAETIGLWFLGGTAVYVVRMAQGSLVPAMVVYVLGDFALRTGRLGDATHGPNWFVKGLSPGQGLIFWLILTITVVAAWQIIRAKNAAASAKHLPLQATSAT
jgi:hypothetical protein